MQTDQVSVTPGAATSSPDPIIVTGAPRTGVRLLAAMLDRHPVLASGPDLPVMATLVQQWQNIETNLGLNHTRHHGLPADATRNAFREAAQKLLLPRLRRTGKRRFVLQTFTAAMLLPQFALLFPAAQFVYMVRDPRDVVRSLLRCDWHDVRTGMALPYTRNPVAAAKFTVDFMQQTLGSALALQRIGRLMLLAYEELCDKPEESASNLGMFLQEAAPQPRILPDSAALVTHSPDNPHPALRIGAVDSTSLRYRRDEAAHSDLGPLTAAADHLRRKLGYRDAL